MLSPTRSKQEMFIALEERFLAVDRREEASSPHQHLNGREVHHLRSPPAPEAGSERVVSSRVATMENVHVHVEEISLDSRPCAMHPRIPNPISPPRVGANFWAFKPRRPPDTYPPGGSREERDERDRLRELRTNPFHSPFSGLLAHMYSNVSSLASSKEGSEGAEAFAHVDANAEEEMQEIELASGASPPHSTQVPGVVPPSTSPSRLSSRVDSNAGGISGVQSQLSEGEAAGAAARAAAAHGGAMAKTESMRAMERAQSLHRNTRTDSAKARWAQATWFAIQEAQRRKRHESLVPDTDDAGAVRDTSPLQRLRQALCSRAFDAVMIAVTLYALFVPDVYFLAAPSPHGDDALYWCTFVVFVLFVSELALKSVAVAGYFLSFFFVLDLVAALSFVPDVAWVLVGDDIISGIGGLNVARASRSARVAVRVARIMRVARLLLRFKMPERAAFRRYTATSPPSTSRPARTHSATFAGNPVTFGGSASTFAGNSVVWASPVLAARGTEGVRGEDINPCDPAASAEGGGGEEGAGGLRVRAKYGDALQDKAVKAVVFAVITYLILGIIAEFALTLDDSACLQLEGEMLAAALHLGAGGNLSAEAFQRATELFVDAHDGRGTGVLHLSVGGQTVHGEQGAGAGRRRFPRESIHGRFEDAGGTGLVVELLLDDRVRATRDYLGNIVLVMIVLVALVSSSWGLMGLLRREVIRPIEGMLDMVVSFAQDPLRPLSWSTLPVHQELQIVQSCLVKLGLLLQLAVGTAGAKTITASLRSAENGLSTQGKIVHAFFGFCDIRRFTDITEALQAEAVKVVNGVAHYVHRAVGESNGFPNKNIGDAFLLVWRPRHNVGVQQTAESALRSYLRIIIEVSRSKVLRRWVNSAAAARHVHPPLDLRVGFGLHFGWAVEGAIGSPMKIDASYLSPHVNMASRLEAATKQYGVDLLFSEDVFRLLSLTTQSLCRLVDRITVKGSSKPISIYTYDVPALRALGGELADSVDVGNTHLSNEEFFKTVPPSTSAELRALSAEAMELYLGGTEGRRADWDEAEAKLREVLAASPDDGPSLNILSYLQEERGPERRAAGEVGWPGYRVLSLK